MMGQPQTEFDIEALMEERRRMSEERMRLDTLVVKYQRMMPKIAAKWDTAASCVDHNDILPELVKAGLTIYSCSMDEMWQGLFEPKIYDADTLWSDVHDRFKIAKVIEAWELGQALTPIFLAKHGEIDLAVVPDGKHRLTVSRAIQAVEMPFMVLGDKPIWVSKVFPGAKRILV